MPSRTLVTKDKITIRMYRNVLGDCFLLRHSSARKVKHILIDCGILQGVGGAPDQMRAIADDIAKSCGGVLDLVVVTHEHHDHLSGFNYARDTFFGGALKLKELWLAWTENRVDERAQALRERRDTAKNALALMLKAISPANMLADGATSLLGASGKDSQRKRIRALADFVGPTEAGEHAANGNMTGAQVIEKLKTTVGAEDTHYLEPGQAIRVGGDGLRALVLGPPRKDARLRKDRPSQGAAKEVFLTGEEDALAMYAAASAIQKQVENIAAEGTHCDPNPLNAFAPFARPYCRPLKQVRDAFEQIRAGQARRIGWTSVEELYFASQSENRAIQGSWLDSAEALALKLDADTNNTSLVLAFELSDGQVLLFPGDAQVGNWLSWQDQTYPGAEGSRQHSSVTIDELLARVTFYKVAHHASHNATLRADGLEKMKRLQVAMIPVVEKIAKAQGDGWQMPYGPLYEELLSRTENRVLRGDGDIAAEKKAFEANPPPGIAASYAPNGLWVEVEICAG